MRDYGGNIPCPACGAQHHISARQLQAELELAFKCEGCGVQVTAANPVAEAIAAKFETIRLGLQRIKI